MAHFDLTKFVKFFEGICGLVLFVYFGFVGVVGLRGEVLGDEKFVEFTGGGFGPGVLLVTVDLVSECIEVILLIVLGFVWVSEIAKIDSFFVMLVDNRLKVFHIENPLASFLNRFVNLISQYLKIEGVLWNIIPSQICQLLSLNFDLFFEQRSQIGSKKSLSELPVNLGQLLSDHKIQKI